MKNNFCKRTILVCLSVLFVLALSVCAMAEDIALESISASSVTVYVGETKSISVSFTPADATNKAYTVNDPAPSCAEVTTAGSVKGVAPGEFFATVTPSDTNAAAITVKIIVKEKVDSVSVTPSSQVLKLDGTTSVQLNASVSPAGANQDVTFESNNSSVAAVSSSGLVTAIGEGDAVITVKSKEDSSKIATCAITVKAADIHPESVSLNPSSVTLDIGGKTEKLTPLFTPADTTNQKVTYVSSNPAVASVSEAGVVTSVGKGTATITVTTEDGGKTASIPVTVIAKVSGVKVSPEAASIKVGATQYLTVTVSPDEADNKSVEFTSSDTSVATVDANGTVKAVAKGTATITVTSKADSSIKATCAITVLSTVTGVTPSATDITLSVGGTANLSASVTPTDVADTSVVYTTSDSSVVSITMNGTTCVLSALKEGSAEIRVTSVDNPSVCANVTVTVGSPKKVTSVTVDPTEITTFVGSNATITAVALPADAANRTVRFKSSDTAIVTVNDAGVCTGVAAGSATITAYSLDGGAKTDIPVTVKQYPTSMIITSGASKTLVKGTDTTITYEVGPAGADDAVTYSSSNTSVVSVFDNGKVVALADGTATVTVTSKSNPAVSASCTFTVGTPVTSIVLSPVNADMLTGEQMVIIATVLPADASNKNIVWTTSDDSKARVSGGVVTAYSASESVVITATAADGSGEKAQCVIKVSGASVATPTPVPTATPTPTPTLVPTPTPTPKASGETAQVNTVKGALNLRQTPNGTVIGKIPESAYFTVLERGTTWCKATYGGMTGYVMTKYVKFSTSVTPTPTATATSLPGVIDYAKVTTETGGLNLRATINGTRIAVIPKGAVVNVHTKGATWSYVSYGGQAGYVMTKFLTFGAVKPVTTATPTSKTETVAGYKKVQTANGGGLNMRTAANIGSTRIAVIPQGTVISYISAANGWTRVLYNGQYGYVMSTYLTSTTSTPVPTAVATSTPTSGPSTTIVCYGKVTCANGGALNMRTGAGTNYARVCSIPYGKAVDVYQKGSTWSYVGYGSQKGYVMSQYLTFSSTKPKEEQSASNQAQVTTASGALNLRSGAGNAYALIDKIPQKAYVTVNVYGATWCNVTYNGKTGYVMTKFLTFTGK